MLIGDLNRFAIESSITTAYERLSFRALGCFVMHIGGICYGVRKPDATMLACSWDEVEQRLAERGKHNLDFAEHPVAGEIADAVRFAIYAPDQEDKYFFGLSQPDFSQCIHSQKLVWAPDGNEAFDDGSFVLQFDVGNRVRLIAFKTSPGYYHDPSTLRDVWLEAEEFYQILKAWHAAFASEWQAAPKIPERDGRTLS